MNKFKTLYWTLTTASGAKSQNSEQLVGRSTTFNCWVHIIWLPTDKFCLICSNSISQHYTATLYSNVIRQHYTAILYSNVIQNTVRLILPKRHSVIRSPTENEAEHEKRWELQKFCYQECNSDFRQERFKIPMFRIPIGIIPAIKIPAGGTKIRAREELSAEIVFHQERNFLQALALSFGRSSGKIPAFFLFP